MSILIFFIILLILVMVHELGHFIAAKISKMRVEEFAFGFPPKLFGKKVGETLYAFNLLPIGGYVKITGESFDPEETARLKSDKKAFQNRPRILQLFVLFAGVFMNLLLAFAIFTFINSHVSYISKDDPVYGSMIVDPKVIVIGVTPNSPSAAAGLREGDIILSVSAGAEKVDLLEADSVAKFVQDHKDSSIAIEYQRGEGADAHKSSSVVSPVFGLDTTDPSKKLIGLGVTYGGKARLPITEAIQKGFLDTYNYTKLTIVGLKDVVKKLINREPVLDSLAGPVGIAKMTGQVSEQGFDSLLFFVAFLSINLAVFNILPIPALDGGRILFVLYEMIFRRSIPVSVQYWANSIGFLLLIGLMFVVTYKDILG